MSAATVKNGASSSRAASWLPRSIECLRAGYTRAAFVADLVAGLTVGLVALPLAMAFGIASGVTPRRRIPERVCIRGSSHPDTCPSFTSRSSFRLLTTV